MILILDSSKGRRILTEKEKNPYPDRKIKFIRLNKNSYKEIHFDKRTRSIIPREVRKKQFPVFNYFFFEHNLYVKLMHIFLDEVENSFFPTEDIDVETVTSEILSSDGKSLLVSNHFLRVNQERRSYFLIAKNSLENYMLWKKEELKSEEFMKNKYANFDSNKKVEYLIKHINFQERMASGFPPKYKGIFVLYLSKNYVDSFGKYDKDPVSTLIKVLDEFDVQKHLVIDMLQHEIDSEEWLRLAKKNKLFADEDD